MDCNIFCTIVFAIFIDITVGEKQEALRIMTSKRRDAPVNSCDLPKVVGPCKALFPSWAYVKANDSCVPFNYGGCQGNCNRFLTQVGCEDYCQTGDVKPKPTLQTKKKLAAICSLPPETGSCKAYFKRYFFNAECERCEAFVYGGCDGNENNFMSIEECEESCGRNDGTCNA